MKRFGHFYLGLTAALLGGAGCSDSAYEPTETLSEQQFIVAVESMGELFTGGEGVVPTLPTTRRPISSVAPTQTFDKLSILIVEYRTPARVVFKGTIDDWSSPNNLSSIPWSLESGQGRYATVSLRGEQCLVEGTDYMAYAIGYQSGTFGGGISPLRGSRSEMYITVRRLPPCRWGILPRRSSPAPRCSGSRMERSFRGEAEGPMPGRGCWLFGGRLPERSDTLRVFQSRRTAARLPNSVWLLPDATRP